MLDTTLATTFVPGTNLKGDVAGANWAFLLPSLELEQVVCLGAPRPTTLTMLSRLSDTVGVICLSESQRRAVVEASQRADLMNVHALAADRQGTLPALGGGVDLILIVDRSSTRRLRHDRALLSWLHQLLTPEGGVYFEVAGIFDGFLDDEWMKRLAQDFGATERLWLTPMSGEMFTAVPLEDRETIKYFMRHALYAPSLRLRGFKPVGRILSRQPWMHFVTRRHGVLIGKLLAESTKTPPRYLRAIAQAAGIDIRSHRWGLVARGRYSSRKVLYYLFPQTGQSPEYIVKMTRDSTLNYRLESAHRALMLMQEKGIGAADTLPQVAFFGHHAGLAILGEKAIEGVPFRRRTTATADCPYARAAIDWLIGLGAASANRTAATAQQVAEGLERLFGQFTQIYQLTSAHRDFMNRQLVAIARSESAFPLVIQHGDPGTWNMMVTARGQVVFLDWEAAEPEGMPLWDLFYFLRSQSVGVGKAHGLHSAQAAIEQLWLTESPFSSLVVEATWRYCERVGVPEHLIEPLFYTCWMHRALKEATRLRRDRLEDGHYVNLLRLCIEQRAAPTLRRLFSVPIGAAMERERHGT